MIRISDITLPAIEAGIGIVRRRGYVPCGTALGGRRSRCSCGSSPSIRYPASAAKIAAPCDWVVLAMTADQRLVMLAEVNPNAPHDTVDAVF